MNQPQCSRDERAVEDNENGFCLEIMSIFIVFLLIHLELDEPRTMIIQLEGKMTKEDYCQVHRRQGDPWMREVHDGKTLAIEEGQE